MPGDRISPPAPGREGRMQETAAILTAALSYARRGWHVFPCRPRAKDPDGRLAPRGHLQATTDEATIRRWWAASPHANIGIACGPSGLIVLDIDPRHGGDENLRDLLARCGPLPETV